LLTSNKKLCWVEQGILSPVEYEDEMIRRSDEKVEYSDEPDPLYTRGDLLKYVQEL